MTSTTCKGCRIGVEIDPRSGRIETGDGAAGTALLADGEVVVWECPRCEYPHADIA